MKTRLYLFLALTALISIGGYAQKPIYRGKCVGVHDGDTITVLVGDRQMKVRLEGIDAPELGQDFSQRSKEFLANLVFGQDVTIKEYKIDRYGRSVSRIYIGYRDVSSDMISSGLAWHFKKYSSDSNLAQLEDSARGRRIGLWSMPFPKAPWIYRADPDDMPSMLSPVKSAPDKVIHTGPRGGKYYINSKGKKVYVKKKK